MVVGFPITKTFINYMSLLRDMTLNRNMYGLVKVQKNGDYGVKVTIPIDVARERGIAPGDLLLVGVDEHGRIVMAKQGVLA